VDTEPKAPEPSQPQQAHQPQETRRPRQALTPQAIGRTALALLIPLAATAVIGIPAGYIWALLAPRALARVVSRGAAQVVNPETTAFIAADAWFVLIAAVGGLLTGIAGYLLLVRRWGAPAALGLILGGLAAAALMLWIGDNYGHAAFQHRLLTDRPGTYLHAALSLGSKGALAFWPMVVALVIVVPEAAAYLSSSRKDRAARSAGQPAVRPAEPAGAPADPPGRPAEPTSGQTAEPTVRDTAPEQ
jgi:hypothetical protein